MRRAVFISILAALLIAAPAFAQQNDCTRSKPCGQVPWSLPYLPPLVSPSPMATIATTPLPNQNTLTPSPTATMTATTAPTPTPYNSQVSVTSFSQSYSANLVTNGDLSSWSGDNPTWWSVSGESGSDPMLTQVDPSGSAGTGAARFYASGATNNPSLNAFDIRTIGLWYESSLQVTAWTSGALNDTNGTAQRTGQLVATKAQTAVALGRATATSYGIAGRGGTAHDHVVDNIVLRQVTLNPQYEGLADGTFEFHFDITTARFGEIPELWYRASDDSNKWRAIVWGDGSAWYTYLYSCVSGSCTQQIFAGWGGGGTPNAMRVVTSGNNHSFYVSSNDGGSWVQQGTTISNSTMSTNTGVRAVYTSQVTPRSLIYTSTTWPATAIPGTTIPIIQPQIDTSGLSDQLATLGAMANGTPFQIMDLQGTPVDLEAQFAELATPAGLFFGYARGLSEINLGSVTTFIQFAMLTVSIILALTATQFLLPIIATAFGVIRRVAQLVLEFLPL